MAVLHLNTNHSKENAKVIIYSNMTLGEISAVEELMRMAVTGQQHVDGLVGYYRSLIDSYNDERADWALHYEQLKDSASNKHALQRELDHSRQNINLLEAQLNTTKAGLARERQTYFEALQLNQNLKDKCEEHKKRYREMVALCKPITVGKQRKPDSRSGSNNPSHISSHSSDSHPSHPRTQLELELINLSKDHELHRGRLTEAIASMKQELDELLSEHGERGRVCSREYRNNLEKLGTVEGKIMHLTTEYFKLRMENYQSQRRLQEQNEILRLKAVAMAKRLQLLRSSHDGEFKTVQKQVKDRNRDYRSRYDSQLRQKEQHLSILRQQHARINDIYLLKLTKLEQELRDTTERQKQLEEKHRSEGHSLRGQIRILRGRLEKAGIREMRAQLAEEESEESSETLSVGELEKLNREVEALERRM